MTIEYFDRFMRWTVLLFLSSMLVVLLVNIGTRQFHFKHIYIENYTGNELFVRSIEVVRTDKNAKFGDPIKRSVNLTKLQPKESLSIVIGFVRKKEWVERVQIGGIRLGGDDRLPCWVDVTADDQLNAIELRRDGEGITCRSVVTDKFNVGMDDPTPARRLEGPTA